MSTKHTHREFTQRTYEERVARIRTFIDQNCCEWPSIDFLAEQCGWTPFHFHRVFRSIVGEPVGRYARRKRLEYAATFLAHSDASIEDVTEILGYESACVFSRGFKDLFGVSPSIYRQLQKSHQSGAALERHATSNSADSRTHSV